MSAYDTPQGDSPRRTHYHPTPKGVGFIVRKFCNHHRAGQALTRVSKYGGGLLTRIGL